MGFLQVGAGREVVSALPRPLTSIKGDSRPLDRSPDAKSLAIIAVPPCPAVVEGGYAPSLSPSSLIFPQSQTFPDSEWEDSQLVSALKILFETQLKYTLGWTKFVLDSVENEWESWQKKLSSRGVIEYPDALLDNGLPSVSQGVRDGKKTEGR
jgi:hypothetical protein